MSGEKSSSKTVDTNDTVDLVGVQERSVDTKKEVRISEVEKMYAVFSKT